MITILIETMTVQVLEKMVCQLHLLVAVKRPMKDEQDFFEETEGRFFCFMKQKNRPSVSKKINQYSQHINPSQLI
ncbi:hypothetical protein [Bacillus oleivorans]|uniref:hypothetical protein n=1 Tax=Bacillus oleivorans TaxID=1448271 RepID=UPI000BE2A118|nr:hypothetical protein [Bacillus oleivorans]